MQPFFLLAISIAIADFPDAVGPVIIIMFKILYTKETVADVYKYILQNARRSSVVFLNGEVGTGKTFLVSQFLKSQGIDEPVTSPTFSIFKEYFLPKLNIKVFHYDLYRIKKPEELMFLDIEENLNEGMLIIEWPEAANLYGIKPSLEILLFYNDISTRYASITLP